jgi:uncharacterized protein (DUF58 family)
MLIEPQLLKRLERLSLQSRRLFRSPDAGNRRSLQRGVSIDFSDYREYRPGDDLRYLDWKAYGRLEKLFLKLFLDEDDLSLHLLIDSSQSMSFGAPISKWRYAQLAAAAIGFIALHENNRVDAAAFSARLNGRINPLRGDASIPTFLRALEGLKEPSGPTDFFDSIRQYAATTKMAGLVIVFSDFFDDNVAAGLASLAARRHQVVLVQILDRSEINPDLDGDYRLIDSETGLAREVTLSNYEIQQYSASMSRHSERLMEYARKYEMDFLRVVTDEPVEDLVMSSLTKAGIVR